MLPISLCKHFFIHFQIDYIKICQIIKNIVFLIGIYVTPVEISSLRSNLNVRIKHDRLVGLTVNLQINYA